MNARRVEAFLLRLVIHENSTASPQSWRGRIQHVASGAERKIDHLQDAIAFINQCLGVEVRLEQPAHTQVSTPTIELTVLNREQPQEVTD